LVLVNALYFKAAWLVPFEVATTHDEDFATPDRPVRTKMMRQVSRFAYHHGDGAALVELPYRDSSISMVVFLPDDPSGLTELEHHIARDYARWVTAASPTRVDLWLPRWKATATHDLRTPLKHLGMELPFSCRADFSGMTDEVTDDVCPVGAAGPTRPATLHIDDVVQKAFVDVDEQGTEAAAATAVAMTLALSAHDTREEKPVIFHADHPFHYVIRDRRTGVILFVGRVTQPELARQQVSTENPYSSGTNRTNGGGSSISGASGMGSSPDAAVRPRI
jgi:serpin B